MKKTIVLLFTVFLGLSCFAQIDTTTKKDITDEVIFTVAQQPAEFPGGIQGWMKYLNDSLNSSLGSFYIAIPKGQKVAKVTVMVSFVIDKSGNVSEVHALNTIPEKVHPVFINEAIRVIKNGPKWIPAKQNGRIVKYRHKQSITWQVTEE